MSISVNQDLSTYLSTRQAAQLLGVSKAYACRLFVSSKIPAIKIDTDWIVAKKDIQNYLDERNNIPVYYRNTDNWSRNDFYFLYRVLDRMIHDRKNRYAEELRSIDIARLSSAACTLLIAMEAQEKIPELSKLRTIQEIESFDPPLFLSDYPSIGEHPTFEEYGVYL